MSMKRTRPGRVLTIFFGVLALAFVLVAVAGSWVPKLGLDLQGGTRITLIAKSDGVTAANLSEAAQIIDDRVNGSGVSESQVTTQGSRYIIVEIPGASRRDLVETVKRQAMLRFRVVAKAEPATVAATPSVSAQPSPGVGVLAPKKTKAPAASASVAPGTASAPATPAATASPSTRNRGVLGWAEKSPKASPSADATVPAVPASAVPTPLDPAATPAPAPVGTGDINADPLTWMDNPDAKSVEQFTNFQCPADGSSGVTDDDPTKPLVTCAGGMKYLLSKAMIEGTALDSADASAPGQQSPVWKVVLNFDGPGTKEFSRISRALVGTEKQFAIVLDGGVISAPTMDGFIGDGRAEISGNFTEQSAMSLATQLKYGALPVAFEKDPQVELVGPSLAGNQLSAGLWAGGIGLFLVMLYCLLYYRGLGLVVIASLIVAAASTYAAVLLLSKAAGFTLSLPGIAGLIVAVGITADSFVVFFERIRDEMRDGKTMRVAVDAGWARARNTCLAADAVTLLAAVVLYIFAAGVVKGFAFALGLSTLIDLAVFFWFTHPMVVWLGRFHFFNSGSKLSGLDREALGVIGGKA